MLLSTIKKHIILAGALLTFSVVCFLSPTMARAELVPLTLIPQDGSWATGCGGWQAGQNIRVSKPPTITNGYLDYRNQTIQATAGDTIDLEVVIYTTSCSPTSIYYPNSTGNYISNIQIDGGATVTPTLDGLIAITQYNSNVLSIETYRIAIRVTIPANLPTGTKTFTVGLNGGEKINLFNNGVYQCVLSGGNRTGYNNALNYYGCAPGPASLSFNVNVQAAIPPNYLGQIQTLKYNIASPTVVIPPAPTGDQKMLDAKTYIIPCDAPAICSNEGSSNWLTNKYMWVYQGGPGIGNGVQNIHSSKIVVPPGYRVNNAKLIRDNYGNQQTDVTPTTTADEKLLCDGTNNTGTCSIGTKVWNQDTTFVQWFLEKIPPTLNVSCISDNPTTGGKITVTASSPLVTNPVISERYDSAAVQNRTLNAGSYTFDIASKYRDGNDHTYYATYDGLSKSITFGPNQLNCKIDKWFYPWLQTSQGDVVADGKIEGQTTSTGTGTLGARLDNATAKEAEFLVISAVAGGGPFCSTYKYILTNTSSQGTDCGNGAGYNFNSTGIDNDTVDRVIGGVKQAFADNGNNANPTPSACSASGIATATVTTMPTSISTTCPGGVIYKLSSGTLGRTVLLQGRATIFVDGPLTITDDLLANRAQADPRLAPALAIVVTGNINIAYNASFDGISYIDAQLYSAEKINTCTTSAGNLATTNECSIPLKVKGSLSAKKGFEFKRTYVEPSNLAVYREPAESIKMTGMHLAFPPPGLDSRYFYNNFSSYKLDSAEYNPRF